MFPLVPAAKMPADVATTKAIDKHVPEEIVAGGVTRLVTGVPLAKTPTSCVDDSKVIIFIVEIGRINPPSDNTAISRGTPPKVPTEAMPSVSNVVSRTPAVLILNALATYDIVLFANDEI
jgi:hypothetical protein